MTLAFQPWSGRGWPITPMNPTTPAQPFCAAKVLSNDESHGSAQWLGLTEFTTPATPPFACMGAHLRIPLSTDVRFLTVTVSRIDGV